MDRGWGVNGTFWLLAPAEDIEEVTMALPGLHIVRPWRDGTDGSMECHFRMDAAIFEHLDKLWGWIYWGPLPASESGAEP